MILCVPCGTATTDPYESMEFMITLYTILTVNIYTEHCSTCLCAALYFYAQNRSGLPFETIAKATQGEAVWQARHRTERQWPKHCKEQCGTRNSTGTVSRQVLGKYGLKDNYQKYLKLSAPTQREAFRTSHYFKLPLQDQGNETFCTLAQSTKSKRNDR